MDNGGGGVEGRGVCHKAGWQCRSGAFSARRPPGQPRVVPISAAIMVAGHGNTISTIPVGSDVDACYAEHEGVCARDARSEAGLCTYG